MKKTKTAEQWWKDLGSYTKQLYQRRHYPATNWLYLTDEMIETIYNKEKQKNK
jgi:hypothetical protein